MKKLFILFLFLLPFITVEAKTIHKVVNPTYIGMQHGTMEITSVKTTEEATTVTFRYPGNGFGYFDSNIYLVDEQGKHYGLIGQKGFSEDSLKNMKPKKKGKYELYFQPLPVGTQIFDIIENFYDIGGSRFYGVREKDTPLKTIRTLGNNQGEVALPDIDFKVDSVMVTGQIKNYQSANNKFKVVRKYNSSSLENAHQRNPKTSIDENGNFCMKIEAIGPTWTYLIFSGDKNSGKSMFIPVVLYPDDHIDLQITLGEDDNRTNVTYNSKQQKDFSHLMKCAPITYVNSDVTPNQPGKDYSTEYERMTPESVQKYFDDYDMLALYLSDKYDLNRVETEMLRSHLSVAVAINVIGLTNRYLINKEKKATPKEDRQMAYEKWRNSDSPYYSIAFSNIRTGSNAFLATPYWTNLFSPYNMRNIPRNEKMFNDFLISPITPIHGNEQKEDYFKNNEVTLLYEQVLQLIREWRQKKEDDALFEQSLLLCCIQDLRLGIPQGTLDNGIMKQSMVQVYRQYALFGNLFNHPSVVRMASTLIERRRQEIYQEQEDYRENLESK